VTDCGEGGERRNARRRIGLYKNGILAPPAPPGESLDLSMRVCRKVANHFTNHVADHYHSGCRKQGKVMGIKGR